MKYAVDSKSMKKIDGYTMETVKIPSLVLMERAAHAVTEVMKRTIRQTDRILAVCGPGNNGGDGVAAGRILFLEGYHVAILFIGDKSKCTEQMKAQLEIARNLGILIENSNKLHEYNIIIDAIFGVGLSKPVTGEIQSVIHEINECKNLVYAVDIPSGISADSGKIMNAAIKADVTVTFGYNKQGLLLYPGAEYAGKVIVADIGFPESALLQVKPNSFYYEPEDVKRIPGRPDYSHKGSFGKVLIIAGSKGMCGAACLSAKAAYRSGAGLVKVLSSKENRAVIQSVLPEALFSAYDEDGLQEDERQKELLKDLSWATVIVIGPGLGLSPTAKKLFNTVIEKAKVPVILDADAISLLAGKLDRMSDTTNPASVAERLKQISELLKEDTVLTPHLGELSRLLGVPVSEISDNIIDTASQCSYNKKLVYVIKDARTIVAGDSSKYINVSGNNGMATGGSGDVLTGIIAALAAQGMTAYEAACLGVYIHGLAGDKAAEEKGTYSLMAGDIVNSIEKVLINVK